MRENRKIYDVVITETAWEQILEHARFLAQVNIAAANRLVDDFAKSCEALAFMPERCPWLEHSDIPFQKYRKRLISKNYMALFLIQNETVYVASVVDCRSDYKWLV
jgi:plasmid stabilization system protein ParE